MSILYYLSWILIESLFGDDIKNLIDMRLLSERWLISKKSAKGESPNL